MRKFVLAAFVVAMVALLLPGAVFAEIIDPNVAFCNVPASSACGGDPNIVTTTTQFGMFPIGSNDSSSPWHLLIAVPEGPAAAQPTVTSGSFTVSFVTSKTFLSTDSGDIYALFGLFGVNSMNATNMFGSSEQAAFGGTPTDFDVFEYSVTGGFTGNTAYTFDVSGGGLIAGTFIAASAIGPPGCDPTVDNGKNACNMGFSTPFTTSGLVSPPSGHQPPPSPEPASLALFGTGLVGIAGVLRRKMNK